MLCNSKTAITFAYDIGLKSFLYEKVSERKVAYDAGKVYNWPLAQGKSHRNNPKINEILKINFR
jgi:hypothetical protein